MCQVLCRTEDVTKDQEGSAVLKGSAFVGKKKEVKEQVGQGRGCTVTQAALGKGLAFARPQEGNMDPETVSCACCQDDHPARGSLGGDG